MLDRPHVSITALSVLRSVKQEHRSISLLFDTSKHVSEPFTVPAHYQLSSVETSLAECWLILYCFNLPVRGLPHKSSGRWKIVSLKFNI